MGIPVYVGMQGMQASLAVRGAYLWYRKGVVLQEGVHKW